MAIAGHFFIIHRFFSLAKRSDMVNNDGHPSFKRMPFVFFARHVLFWLLTVLIWLQTQRCGDKKPLRGGLGIAA
jgi:hypothetical protein